MISWNRSSAPGVIRGIKRPCPRGPHAAACSAMFGGKTRPHQPEYRGFFYASRREVWTPRASNVAVVDARASQRSTMPQHGGEVVALQTVARSRSEALPRRPPSMSLPSPAHNNHVTHRFDGWSSRESDGGTRDSMLGLWFRFNDSMESTTGKESMIAKAQRRNFLRRSSRKDKRFCAT